MAEEKSRLSRFFHRSGGADHSDRDGEEKRSFERERDDGREKIPQYNTHHSIEESSSSTATFTSTPHHHAQQQQQQHVILLDSKKIQPPPPPNYAPSKTTFASLSLHSTDKIRLLEFPVEIIEHVRICIQKSYAQGIQGEKQNYGGAHEFKLRGYPWAGQGSDAISSRIVVREILSTLWSHGWVLLAGVDVSRKEADCDTLLFRHEPSTATSPPRRELEFMAVSFNEYDKFRYIISPTASHTTSISPLITTTSDLLKSLALYSREEWKDEKQGAYQFKCSKYVWASSGEDTMRSRWLLVGLLNVLEIHGWALYASLDQSTVAGNVSENDTWYVVRERGWVEGMKVWHR